MNGKRKIVVVSALGIVALAVSTGWSVLAGNAWPPEPYRVYSLTGLWTSPGANTVGQFSPEDQFGTGLCEVAHLSLDPTVGGAFPAATSATPVYLKYVRTGPDSWQSKGLFYLKQDTKPKPTIVVICVVDATAKMTAPGELDWTMTQSLYLGSQDKDLDGLPDAGEKPFNVSTRPTGHWQAL